MQFNFSQPLALPPSLVLEYMCNESFQAEKASRLGAQEFSMLRQDLDGETVVRTERQLPTVGLPEFVKALVRPMMCVAETERWEPQEIEGTFGGAFEIDVDGAPVRFRGRVSVLPEASGSRITFTGSLTSTVPLFRSHIEEASAEMIRETMAVECAMLEEKAR